MLWFVAVAGGVFYALWRGTVSKAEVPGECVPDAGVGEDGTPLIENLPVQDGSESAGEPLPDPKVPEPLPDPSKPEELPYEAVQNPFKEDSGGGLEGLGIDIPDGHQGSLDDILPNIDIDVDVEPFEEEFNLEGEPEEEAEEV